MLLNRYYLRVLEYIGCPYSRLLTVIMDGKKAGVFCGYSDKTQISPVDPGVLLFCPVRQEIVRVKNEGSPEPPGHFGKERFSFSYFSEVSQLSAREYPFFIRTDASRVILFRVSVVSSLTFAQIFSLASSVSE